MTTRRQILSRIITNHQVKIGAEIGVGTGPTTKHLMDTHPDLQWIGVDHFPHGYPLEAGGVIGEERAREVRGKFTNLFDRYQPRLRWLDTTSLDAAKTIEDGSLDLVFIDADHSYEGCRDDILAWRPKLRPGGWLSGHDYCHYRYPGVVRAVREYVPGFKLEEDFVWFVQVPA